MFKQFRKKVMLKSKSLMTIGFVAVILIFFITNLSAQTTGEIAGKVIDGETGDILRRASVMIVGTNQGAISDVKGEFRIRNVKPGAYTLRFSYVGYNNKDVTDVVVNAGATVNLNVPLELEARMKEEVVVTARRVYDNEAAILAQRRNAAQVSDGLSSEQMSKLPDSDAGQSLKRVSGVTLVNNKFVFVRGVSERYSNTTLNGAGLASTEPDKKSFSYDMFPTDFLHNVNIAKSFTPDLPGNFAGGLVQLNTIDFPHGRSLKVSLSSNVNSNVTFKDNEFIRSTRSSTDWLATDDGMRSMPSEMPATRREFNDLQNRAKDPFDTTGARAQYESLSQSFNSNLFTRENTTINPFDNRSISLAYTDLYKFEQNELGIIGSFNYGSSNAINNVQRNGYMGTFDTMYTTAGKVSETNYNLGGLLNIAYKFGGNNVLNFKNVFNRSADDEMLVLEGRDIAYQYLDYKNYSYHFVQKSFYSGQLGGEHSFSFLNSFVDWRLGYSSSERDEPDFRRLKFSRSLHDIVFDPNTPYTPEILPTMQGDGARLGRFFSNLFDEVYTSGINFTVPVLSAKLKFGGLYEKRTRDFKARSLTIINPSYLDMEIEELMHDYKNPQKIFASENFKYEGGFLIGEESKLSDNYDAEEDLYSAYLMLDIPISFTIFNSQQNFRFIAGVRYEDNNQKLSSFYIDDNPVNVNRRNQDVLPSLNFIWQSSQNTNVRLSASQTLARPEFRELAPFTFYDYLQHANIQGNPNLVRALIQNYDARYEWFPSAGEVASISVFYKTFHNAIEETIFPEQSELTRTFANALGDAHNYGVEFELRKNLGFISNIIQNFAFVFNLALINTEISVSQGGDIVVDKRQMWGQSPYTINLGLFYTNPETGTDVNLAYNRFGRRIIQVAQQGIYSTITDDPHIYELPRNVIDLSVSQKFGSLEVKLSARDILNEKLVWEQDGKLVATNLRGTGISLSLGYKIF